MTTQTSAEGFELQSPSASPKKKRFQSSREWRLRKIAEGKCSACGRRPHAKNRKLCQPCLDYYGKRSSREWKKNRALWIQRSKDSYHKLKDQCFEAYGGYICKCCGELQRLFLTLDHINNDGAAERKRLFGSSRKTGGAGIFRYLKKKRFPPGYQVLCMNCNWGKRMNNGLCPHKQT